MAEYIDRDAFLEQQRAWYCKDCNRRKNTRGEFVYEIGEGMCRACDIGTMLDAVEDYPAADVVERKAGKWRRYSPLTDTFECNQCGYQVIDKEFRTNFCPNCGADMRPEPPKEEEL